MKDTRLRILLLCLVAESYLFVHYGVLYPQYRASLFILIELLRFLIHYLICYYYIEQSSGLIAHRKRYLRFSFALCLLMSSAIVYFGVRLNTRLALGELNKQSLCFDFSFHIARIQSVIAGLVLTMVYFKLKSEISRLPVLTEIDKKMKVLN